MDGSSGHIVPLKITENISKFRDSLLFSFEMMDLKKKCKLLLLISFLTEGCSAKPCVGSEYLVQRRNNNFNVKCQLKFEADRKLRAGLRCGLIFII